MIFMIWSMRGILMKTMISLNRFQKPKKKKKNHRNK